MSIIFQTQFSVEHQHLDANGHVNNVVYVQWMQDVAVMHSNHVGGTKELYTKLNVTWVARTHHIEYVQPAFDGDKIVVQTWLAAKRRVSCQRKYQFVRAVDDAVLARADTQWVYIDLQSGRPRAIHAEVIDRFPIDDPTFHDKV